jgi:hypothetical protein
MKYAITGHLYGVGEELFKRLSPNAIGFTRSTGYDITNKEHRARMIKEAADCDVFINNAHSGFGQVYLFIDLIRAWGANPEKTIINVGSNVAHRILPVQSYSRLEYQIQKIALKEISEKVPNAVCNIKYRQFSAVNTPRILQKWPQWKNHITVEEAANIILS